MHGPKTRSVEGSNLDMRRLQLHAELLREHNFVGPNYFPYKPTFSCTVPNNDTITVGTFSFSFLPAFRGTACSEGPDEEEVL